MSGIVPRLVGGMLQAGRARRFAAFEAACKDPRAAQEAALGRLVARLGDTALARRLGASKVKSLDDLRTNVPLTTYDDLAPEVEAAMRGVPSQILPGRPDFFALSSGTSGRQKALPVDDVYRREFQGPMQLYLYGIVRDHPTALTGKVLYYVGPGEVGHTLGGAPMGMLSGFNYQRVPPLLRRTYAVPYPAFLVANAVARSYAVARFAIAHSLTFAVAITTQPLAHLGQVMRDHGPRLLADLRDGTLSPPAPMSGPERAALIPHLTRDRERARALEPLLPLTPAKVWPELALASCWHHAGASSHLAELRELWGDVPLRSAIYSATEGWINVPLADGTPSGPVAITTNVVELEPLDRDDTPNGPPLLACDPEVTRDDAIGREYGLVLTSGAGLWRYRLGDVVRVTGRFHATPELMFVRKTGTTSNLVHDLTSETHVRTALDAIACDFPITRWCFGPDGSGPPPRYRLVVATRGAIDATALATAFDTALRQANLGYDDDRAIESTAAARAVVVPLAAFEAWDDRRARVAGAQAKAVVIVKQPDDFPSAPHGAEEPVA